MPLIAHNLHPYQAAIDRRLQAWQSQQLGRRIWEKDPTVWSPKPVPELSDRLGWLTLPREMPGAAPALQSFAQEVRRQGVGQVLLLGMGGSSLAPEMWAKVFGSAAGFPHLQIQDSTHPEAIRAGMRFAPPGNSLFLVSSKSGSTLESQAFFLHYWREAAQVSRSPGRHFAAVTDPGSSLETLARERGFARVFSGPVEVGGRFSALSVFGLLPAALLGLDLPRFLKLAAEMAAVCGPEVKAAQNPGLWLGAVLGELALAGRDKVTFLAAPPLNSFGAWAEQLLAESTGKEGRGIIPIVDEPLAEEGTPGADRLFVWLKVEGVENRAQEALAGRLIRAGQPLLICSLSDNYALGAECFRWEMATAAAGAVLGIQPFDQPNVQLAKDLAKRAMAGGGKSSGEEEPLLRADEEEGAWAAIDRFLAQAKGGDYLALQAFLSPQPQIEVLLQRLRAELGRRSGLATSLGFGPRFLHSTGQLHKGRPAAGLFLQLIDDPQPDLAVPETDYTFGRLIAAQARGDAAALRQVGGRVLRLHLGRQPHAALLKMVAGRG